MINDIQKLSQQLEKMGARQEIINKPAFMRILDEKISGCHIKESLAHSLKAEEDPASGLHFSGDTGRESHQRGKAEFDLRVDQKGKVIMSVGHAERDRFDNHDSQIVNSFEESTFNPLISGGFEVFTDQVYLATNEERIRRETGGVEIKYSRSTGYETTHSQYDTNGNENYREVKTYAPHEMDADNFANQKMLNIEFNRQLDRDDRPKKVSRIELKQERDIARTHNREVTEHLRMSRNKDKSTVDIAGTARGKKVKLETVPINNQYGTSDLRVSRLEQRLEESAQSQE